ncbi:MAG: cell dividion protein FtsZ [Cyanobacteria bacterium RYN_339]|nr:cell dividion protein FtsZ [Cyanobacteria bacterium RYN_339]
MPPELEHAFRLVMPGVSPIMLAGALVGALLLSGLLAYVYKRAAGDSYDADVAQAQILLACIMALVLMVVGESVARAFGSVGILSVIRFRSNVGTASEAATLLGSVAVGMACGAGLFGVAVAGTLFLCVVQILLRRVFGAPEPKPGKQKGGGGKKDKKKAKQEAKQQEAVAVVPADQTQVITGS